MTRVTVGAEVRKLLLDFTTPVELCDESGCILGKMIPIKPDSGESDWIDLTPDLTDEELEKEIDSGEGYSTQELIAEIKRMRGL